MEQKAHAADKDTVLSTSGTEGKGCGQRHGTEYKWNRRDRLRTKTRYLVQAEQKGQAANKDTTLSTSGTDGTGCGQRHGTEYERKRRDRLRTKTRY